MGHKARPWQLQCNYVQDSQNYMEDKRKERRKENCNEKKYKRKIS